MEEPRADYEEGLRVLESDEFQDEVFAQLDIFYGFHRTTRIRHSHAE
jgi:hypothetical protein